ncbi:phage tail protein [Cronobacter sakazakii]|nr:phage tail protein [Cronobacter sakazakii]ELY2762231.1 phage tail protein [Cronobacter sakazakii]PQZ09904.1 phage tail protein [Cronobacter sakazakii]PQZ32233.1 phage tail protein [Cronobacter sakazakii]PUE78819.1 phage tail protein [Cronobacter sakazakii]
MVQVQGGQSALVAFSQQGSQLAGAFGPGGAVVGAFIALASVLTGVLMTAMGSAGNEMEKLEKAATDLNKIVVINSQGVAALSNDYARLAVTNAALATQLRDAAIAKYAAEVEKARSAISNIVDQQSSWLRSINGGAASVKAAGNALEALSITTDSYSQAMSQAVSAGPAFNQTTLTISNTVEMLADKFSISRQSAFELIKMLNDLAANPSPENVTRLSQAVSQMSATTSEGKLALSEFREQLTLAGASAANAEQAVKDLENQLSSLRTEAQQANFDNISKQLEAQRIALTKGRQAAVEYGISQQDLTQEQKDQLIQQSRVVNGLEEEKKAREEAERAAQRQAAAGESVAQKLENLRQKAMLAGNSTQELSREQSILNAQQSLGKAATQAQIDLAGEYAAQAYDTAAALKAQQKAEKDRQDTEKAYQNVRSQSSPLIAADNTFQQQMASLNAYAQLYPQKIAEVEQTRAAIEEQYRQQRMAAMWQEWQQQSEINQLAASAIDSLQGGATNAITGLVNGTQNLQEAFANIGTTILGSVVGGLVEMGIQWVKSQIMGQAAAAASLASTMAQATAAASAWAPAAMSASIATYGSAAAVGQTAYAGSLLAAKGMAVAGAREHGGPVSANSMYRVGEGGKPEIYQANNGSQYMIPGDNGRVISNRDMQKGGGGGSSIIQNINFEINTTGGIDDATMSKMAQMMKQVSLNTIRDQQRPNGLLNRGK